MILLNDNCKHSFDSQVLTNGPYTMEPGKIRKLDEVVVNRIAAGEIIQRPANALKEMLENSLDAKATSIQVVVKSGGLKLLQIQDNGTGIRRDDLEIVCERFTTSKLQSFEDLSSIDTYGFRGEALASISHVAQLAITTKTRGEKCAYKAAYEDGRLKGAVKPCAGNQGTQITVEDLFYNVPMRKQALKAPNEEYQKILDVVCKYAIHNPQTGFILKKFGENASIRTQPKSTIESNISLVYGPSIAKSLLKIAVHDEVLQLEVDGFVTNVNFSTKKGAFLLFINHRAVQSSNLKKAIDQIYSPYLPKGMSPFVYLSINLNPNNVDVNVHPTKHEVHFLHEEEIVEKIRDSVEHALLGGNESRTFYTQALLPGASEPVDSAKLNETVGDKTLVYKFVRTDHNDQKLEKFFGLNISRNASITESLNESGIEKHSVRSKKQELKQDTKLTSVLKLRKAVEDDCDCDLRNIFSELTFVGVVDRTNSLIQYDTKMFLISTKMLAEELCYQMLLYEFGNLTRMSFTSPLPLMELALLGLQDPESGWTEEDGPMHELADRVVEILSSKAPMMKEYFSICISEDGMLESIPVIINDYIPSMAYLPLYMLRLATEVEWDEEQECFRTFCRETAMFYAKIALGKSEQEYKWEIEHAICPALKQKLLPPKLFARNGSVLQMANLPDLYRVFERC
ncbi:DNA mismatch repair protein Mlh1 [Toxorhynchites rutilus septentrionalis]|uniref:DNA mismatch repair protein Mlh1 n=1 Tax=Toxorhynchites rutilus septentrionalis TaxID=329112 RepID=UPI0024786E79|nr:DNA mismatch repair protein Mlh1 [Toxorhynchites rutilus septentrionalis]